jgi:hypothetical protein
MLPSESTLRSAAPASLADPSPKKEERVVIAGGTLVELHPARMGQADILIEGATIAQIGGQLPEDVPRVDGRFVVRDRKLVAVDERELVLRARTAATRLWERMQGYH